VLRQIDYDDTGVLSGTIVADVGEVEVACESRLPILPGMGCDHVVVRSTHADIPHIDRVVPRRSEGVGHRSWQAGVNQKAQAPRSSGERVVLLTVQQIAGEPQCCSDLVAREVVLPLDFVETHPSSQTSHHDGHGRASSPNHGLAVTDLWVDDDLISHPWKRTPLFNARQTSVLR
jgi:hypothetical protein